MKATERAAFRELNKSPFIKFPIKENITTCAHKVSLILQVQLGGVDLPQDKDMNVIRRQFVTETNIVFERVQRLVKCLVDCKAHDEDGPATKNALDLARSIDAGYWEGTYNQLRQVNGLGPAMARKLVQADVKTIQQLAALSTADIERIGSRNPPFGKKMLDAVASFPRLSLRADIGGKTLKTGESARVHIKAHLESNSEYKRPWTKKAPAVTFLAEVSNGKLAHFWRGPLKKLEKGCHIAFTAEMTSIDDIITCYLACEDVVGTMKSVTVRPDIPASAFPQAGSATPMLKRADPSTRNSADYEDDDLDDVDLVAAAEHAENLDHCKPSSPQPSPPRVLKRSADGFLDIDDLNIDGDADLPEDPINIVAQDEEERSTQMDNGKWMCWHDCRGNGFTKNGKKCDHRCCKHGLDKPRKKPKRQVC